MRDLREQLGAALRGRVAVVAVGNPAHGDDGAGLLLAEKLREAGCPSVHVAGTSPERVLRWLAREGSNTVLFLDAVDFHGQPGSVIFLNSAAIKTRFPQISTHKLSLGLLARLIEQEGKTGVWLLGIQPESLNPAGSVRGSRTSKNARSINPESDGCRQPSRPIPGPGAEPALSGRVRQTVELMGQLLVEILKPGWSFEPWLRTGS